jgi:hypothetical protein
LIKWSGLSESNRHLNLGKVPYYHYTKAASNSSFIARFREKLQIIGGFWAKQERSGNLRDASGFHHRRAALAFGEAGGLFLVGVDTAEGFAVRIVHGNQEVVMAATAILAKLRLLVAHRLLWTLASASCFCHGKCLCGNKNEAQL